MHGLVFELLPKITFPMQKVGMKIRSIAGGKTDCETTWLFPTDQIGDRSCLSGSHDPLITHDLSLNLMCDWCVVFITLPYQ